MEYESLQSCKCHFLTLTTGSEELLKQNTASKANIVQTMITSKRKTRSARVAFRASQA